MTKPPPSDPHGPSPEGDDILGSGDLIARIVIATQEDILKVRQLSRGAAASIGFGTVDQTRLATAVSELARNTLTYAGGGRCRVFTRTTERDRLVRIEVEDDGPGIRDVADALVPGYSTGGGLGLGLPAVRKLMDGLTIETRPGLTLIKTWMARRR